MYIQYIQNIQLYIQNIQYICVYVCVYIYIYTHTCIQIFVILKFNIIYSSKQDKPRCNLCWKDSNTLLVGWIDTVRICNIRRRSSAEMALAPDWPQFVVEPSKIITSLPSDVYFF